LFGLSRIITAIFDWLLRSSWVFSRYLIISLPYLCPVKRSSILRNWSNLSPCLKLLNPSFCPAAQKIATLLTEVPTVSACLGCMEWFRYSRFSEKHKKVCASRNKQWRLRCARPLYTDGIHVIAYVITLISDVLSILQ
jgi:hypothetical protein